MSEEINITRKDKTDVLVIGAGDSGMMAAAAAREAGADVI